MNLTISFPIRYKLTLIIMLMCVSVLALTSLAFFGYYRIQYRNSLVANITTQANIIGTNSSAAILFNDKKNAENNLNILKDDPRITQAMITRGDGNLIFARYRNKDNLGTNISKAQISDLIQRSKSEYISHLYNNDHLDLAYPIIKDTKVVGYIIIQSDLKNLINTRDQLIFILFILLLISLLAAALISTLGQKMITQPISTLLKVMNSVSKQSDYSIRAKENRHDEIGLLMKSFNQMLEQIQKHDGEHIVAQEQIRKLAYYDNLTGLPNRALFKELLLDALRIADEQNTGLAIIFFDLDNFKLINDTMGHNTGDLLLQNVAKRFMGNLRSEEVSISMARLGGDEFTLVIKNASRQTAESVVKRLISSTVQPYNIGTNEIFMSISIGVAMFPEDGRDVVTLVKHADTAMYAAKESGKNNYQFYDRPMQQHAAQKLSLETELRHALKHNEFLLHYQPKLCLVTNKIVGFEALLRWQHPRKGLVYPDAFISMAEESGLIAPIGLWVLEKACHQCKIWQRMGFDDLRMSVNLSARQFSSDSLVNEVQKTLLESELHPKYLELELTESMIMTGDTPAIEILENLKAIGIRISIDDFGTGYSSLLYLSQFPLDSLKIDKCFIDKITLNKNDATITNAIITLGHNLSLSIIAEGVESKEQMDTLIDMGCDEIQGFYISKAQPIEAIPKLIRKHNNKTPQKISKKEVPA